MSEFDMEEEQRYGFRKDGQARSERARAREQKEGAEHPHTYGYGYTRNAFDDEYMRKQEREYQEEIRRMEEELRRQRFQQEKHFFDEFFKGKFEKQGTPRSVSSGPISISADMLKKLLMLCHPDKHGNSTLSNTVTAELLKLRGK